MSDLSSRSPTPGGAKGVGLLVTGQLALLVLGFAGTLVARETQGKWKGAAVVLRPWMNVHNLAVSGAHALVLMILTAGALRWARGSPRAGLGALAAAAYGLAMLATLTLAAFPLLGGSGPWPPTAPQVLALRHLVYLPLVARAIGGAALAATLGSWVPRPLGRLALHAGVLALAVIDLVGAATAWWATPKAVLALVHARSLSGGWVGTWALLLVLLTAAAIDESRQRP